MRSIALALGLFFACASPAVAQLTPPSTVTDKQLAALVGKSKNVRHVVLFGCKKLSNSGLTKLAPLAGLERLEVVDCPKLGGRGFAVLRKFKQLKLLRVRGCPKVGDKIVGYLRGLKQLRTLELSDSKITFAGARNLGRALPALERLTLGADKLRDKDLKALQPLKSLRELALVASKIGAAGVGHLGKLGALRRLTLTVGGSFDGSGIALLSGVEELRLRQALSATALPKLAELTKLKRLTLHALTAKAAATFAAPPALTQLSLDASPGCDDDSCARLLSLLPSLGRLDLAGAAPGAKTMAGVAAHGALRSVCLTRAQVEGGALLKPIAGRAIALEVRGRALTDVKAAATTVKYINTYELIPASGTTGAELTLAIPQTLDRRQQIDAVIFERVPHKIWIRGPGRYALLKYSGREMKSRQTVRVTYRARCYPYDLERARLWSKPDAPLSAADAASYLRAEKWLTVDDEALRGFATAAGGKSAEDIVMKLHAAVGARLSYGGFSPVPIGPRAAWQTKKGDCTEYSDLMATACRIRKVPARVVSGVMIDKTAKVRHAWVEVYLKKYGWVPFDVTHNDQDLGGKRPDALGTLRIAERVVRNDPELKKQGSYYYYYYGSPIELKWSSTLTID